MKIKIKSMVNILPKIHDPTPPKPTTNNHPAPLKTHPQTICNPSPTALKNQPPNSLQSITHHPRIPTATNNHPTPLKNHPNTPKPPNPLKPIPNTLKPTPTFPPKPTTNNHSKPSSC
ncbi:unnamed protein product [Ilex paraguariensis]|uniref:Uncharacterized protein n=1 Tax=Ilex paraguariensis TaxID=185542 RepID=A0ABC8SST6_9AQUA